MTNYRARCGNCRRTFKVSVGSHESKLWCPFCGASDVWLKAEGDPALDDEPEYEDGEDAEDQEDDQEEITEEEDGVDVDDEDDEDEDEEEG